MLANKNLTDIAIIEAYYSLKKKKKRKTDRQKDTRARARACTQTPQVSKVLSKLVGNTFYFNNPVGYEKKKKSNTLFFFFFSENA